MRITPDRLTQIRTDRDLLSFLQGDLNWRLEGEPDIDFYDEPELAQDLSRVRARVRSLVPVSVEDEWLILLVDFQAQYYRRDLRSLLRSIRKNQRLSNRFEGRSKTLFIVTMPKDTGLYADVQFVRFFERPKGAPEVRSFGWRNTFAGRTVCDINLPALSWSNRPAWEEAWSVEALTERFYDEFERVFYDFKSQVLSPDQGSDDDLQAFCQLWFNRLLLLAFVERRKWLVTPDGRHDYLRAMWQRHNALGSYDNLGIPSDLAPRSFASVLGKVFTALDMEVDQRRLLWNYTGVVGEVPYLNGGLFHLDEVERHGYSIPDNAFEGVLGDDGLFVRFNFTVTESSPLDQVVAIDPEMLGRVFERLVNDRHKEGKYYTPRPIVSFMVDESLKGYLVEKGVPTDKAALLVDHEAIRDEDSGVHFDGDELGTTRELLTSIRAVDPACGSGAYLLGLLQKLFTLCYVLEWRRLVQNLFPLDRGRFLYKKKLELVQQCIYGVDLDPTAVSIARLRMWLSLAVENIEGEKPRPLPYLDFKIAQGDSLMFPIGANLQSTAESELFHQFSAARFDAESADDSLSDEFRSTRRDEAIQLRKDIQSFADVASLAAFPWPIAFEEVFRSSPPGFDIVVANPPYVNSGELLRSVGEVRKRALVGAYPETGSGTADLLVFFFERGVRLLKPGGQIAFITSNKWLKSGYGGKLRSFLAKSVQIHELLNYNDNEVFKRVIAYPLVTIAGKPLAGALSIRTRYTSVAKFIGSESIPPPTALAEGGHFLPADALATDGAWRFEGDGDERLATMREHGIPLGEYVQGRIYRGVLTGLNEVKIGSDGRMYGKSVPNGVRVVSKEGVFVIDGAKRAELIAEDRRSDEIIKPLAVGRDIRRWRVEDNDRWLIFTRRGINIDAFPAVKRHLAQFRARLEPRPRGSSEGEGRKPGSYKWFEIQDDIAYFEVFQRPKIVYPDMSQEPRYALSYPEQYFANTVYVAAVDDLYLLGVLNSSVFNAQLRSLLNANRGDTQRAFSDRLLKAIVPNAGPQQKELIEGCVQRILDLKNDDADADVSLLEDEIDRRVADLYGMSLSPS